MASVVSTTGIEHLSLPRPEGRVTGTLRCFSLSAARERAIQELSTCFANDDLSLEELESRLDRAYKAKSMDDIVALTADLRGPAALADDTSARASRLAHPGPAPAGEMMTTYDRDRVVAIMSETKRQGLWAVPQHLDVYAMMSDTTIDLSRAQLPAGIIDIRVRAMMASVKIILPPGIRIASRLGNLMSSVSTDDDLDTSPVMPGAPVIRLSGWVTMSELKTTVRRREELGPGYSRGLERLVERWPS
jgi:hypothetical protein